MLSDTRDVYAMDHQVLWDVPSPREATRAYLHRIVEFVSGLRSRELFCRYTKVNATWFGFGGLEAVHTTLLNSAMYGVSLGIANGPHCLMLATFRCMSGAKLDREPKLTPEELRETAEAEASQSVQTWLEFRFMDSLLANLQAIGVQT
jgi:hypothetical protein